MHSFVLPFATLFFGAVTSALPILPQTGTALSNVVSGYVPPVVSNAKDVVPAVPEDATGKSLNVHTVPVTPRAISVIVTEAKVQIATLTQKISYATVQNSTEATLSPIASQIQLILSGATNEINDLAGEPIDIILATVDGNGKLTVTELAELTAGLLELVVGCLGDLEANLGPKVETLISGVLGSTVKAVADLTISISTLVSGFLDKLTFVIHALIPVILNLNLAAIVAALGLTVPY